MEEQYELISKTHLQEYKDEITRLKKELENSKNEKKINSGKEENTLKFKEIVTQIQNESKKERELIVSQLEDIKDLNKKTLDNILNQNQNLTSKLENLVSTLKHLTSTLSEVIEELPSNNTIEISSLLDELKLNLKNNQTQQIHSKEDYSLELLAKLEDIETFMKNLRILLSYVRPNDLKIEK